MAQQQNKTSLYQSELQVPPSSAEAEWSVLGSILLDNKRIATVARIVEAEDFYLEKNALLFEKILGLFKKGMAADLTTVADCLTEEELDNIGGYSYLASIINAIITSSHAEHYAKIVRKKSILRKLIIAGAEITNIGRIETTDIEENILQAQSAIINIANYVKKNERTDIVGILGEYEKLQEIYAEKLQSGISLLGISCGMPKIDYMIDGIRPAHLWVVGGYTSTGKTAFSLNILNSILKQGRRASYFSLEMSNTDIVGRLLGIMTGTSSMRIMKSGAGKPEEVEAINNAKKELEGRDLVIHTTEHELDQLILAMKSDHLNKPVDCFFVDFIQLITVKNAKSEYESITQASLKLQDLAKELNTPIIVLSQVNNEHAKFGKNSQVMGFKGSGGIAAAADFAVELARADKQQDVEIKLAGGLALNIDVHVKKNRHGAIGKIEMSFCGESGQFFDGREVRI